MRVSIGFTDRRKTAKNLDDRRKNWKISTVSRPSFVDFKEGANIAKNAYCSRDIYFQFNKVCRTDISRVIMRGRYESASTIGCLERTRILINMM